jgi:hypothetical protein
MFKPTNRQKSLFENDNFLPESSKRLLKGTWAEGFATKVLPILLDEESRFSLLYCEDNGRPNWSVARMLGLCLLQEFNNMTDQRALESFSFDVRWQYALGLSMGESYLSRRSLIDFRSRLVAVDPKMEMLRTVFNRVGDAAIDDLGISITEQRVDSTLITSNIYTRGRAELFRKTLVHFLDWLSKEYPERLVQLSSSTQKWYEKIKEKGWFGKIECKQVKQLLSQLANRLYEVISLFSDDQDINIYEPFQLVERLFNEHCELQSVDDKNSSNDDNPQNNNPEKKIKILKKPLQSGSSLQSPYDPDAGCSYKGPGYFAHITETCNNESTEIITDFHVTSAAETDRGKDIVVIDHLIQSDKQPQILYEDAGYPTGRGIIEAQKKGTKIIAPMLGCSPIGRDRFLFETETGLCTQCPEGHAPLRHAMRTTGKNKPISLHAYFDGNKCRACQLLYQCVVRGPNNGKKGNFHLEIGEHLIARDKAVAEQTDDKWWDKYAIRAGVEASMSELKRAHGIGKLRVRRMPKVRLAVTIKITACNIKRWLKASGVLEITPSFNTINTILSRLIQFKYQTGYIQPVIN